MKRHAEELWTTQEVANFFKVPLQTIYKWNTLGKIPYYRPGKECRYKMSEVLEWLESTHSAL